MMAFKDGGAGASSIISLCVFAAVTITFIVVCGIYAFKNPDPAECWVIDGFPQLHGNATYPIDDVTIFNQPVNVHSLFVSWFIWGFWTCMTPIICCPLIIVPVFMGMEALTFLSAFCCGCGVTCSWLFWMIFGTVWRFGDMGKACTDDALVYLGYGLDSQDYYTESVDSVE